MLPEIIRPNAFIRERLTFDDDILSWIEYGEETVRQSVYRVVPGLRTRLYSPQYLQSGLWI